MKMGSGLSGPSLLTSLTDLSGGLTDVQISPFSIYFRGKFMEAAENANLTTEFLKMSLKCSSEKLGFWEEAAIYTYCQE